MKQDKKKKPLWYWLVLGFLGLICAWNFIQGILYILFVDFFYGAGSIIGSIVLFAIIYSGLNWWTTD
jgi:hypothetical protein